MTTIALPWRKPKDKTHKIGVLGRFKLFVFKLLYGHVGGLAAVGGYFFCLQLLHGQHTTVFNQGVTLPDIKYFWDHMFDSTLANGGLVHVFSAHDWTTWRHLVRPLYEGIFGGLLYAMVAFNPFKVRGLDTPTRFSRVEMALRFIPTYYRKVSPGQIVALPLTITLYSIPGVAIGIGVDRLLRLILHVKSLAPTLAAHPSVVDKFYAGAFDAKIIGVFASLLGATRPAKPVFNFTLRYFAQRRAIAGKRCHFYHPPAFKLLVRDYKLPVNNAQTAQNLHGRAVHTIVPAMLITIVGWAGLGYYVLRFVA